MKNFDNGFGGLFERIMGMKEIKTYWRCKEKEEGGEDDEVS